MEAGPRHLASIDLHRVKHRDRGDLPGAGRCPFDGLQIRFIQVIRELEGDAILIVVACAPAGLRISDVIVAHDDTVDGNIARLRILPQGLHRTVHLLLAQHRFADQELAGLEANRPKIRQLLRPERELVQALHYVKGHKGDFAVLADSAVQQPDRPGGQITAVLRFLLTLWPGAQKCLKVTGADERLTSHHQPPFIGDQVGDAGDAMHIVGDNLPLAAIAAGGCLHQNTALIGQLDRQAVQLQHHQNLLILLKRCQFLHRFRFIQRKQRDIVGGLHQRTNRRVTHRLRGRIGHADAGGLLQFL